MLLANGEKIVGAGVLTLEALAGDAVGGASIAVPAAAVGSRALTEVTEYAAPYFSRGVSAARFLEGGQGFSTFAKLKSALGSPGAGNHWHHIVEQSQVGRFGAEAIHNTKNVAAVSADIHAKISGYYSSKQPFTNGVTVRQWLREQSFDEQYQFGLDIMGRFGVQ